MSILFIFFALPIATIIISIALQKILRCPPLVAGIIFSIFLIVTFIISNINFLVAAIIYTIISYITAVLTCLFNRFLSNNSCFSCRSMDNCCNNNSNGLVTISNQNQNNNDNCCCNQEENNTCSDNLGFSTRINIIPNSNTNGRTGCICGRYRRR